MMIPLIQRAVSRPERTAITAPEGSFTYAELLEGSASAARRMLAGRPDLAGARVCFLVPPGWDYVVTQWGIWRAGGVAVPLAVSHPPTELAYVIRDTEADAVIAHPSLLDRVEAVAAEAGVRLVTTPTLLARPSQGAPELSAEGPAPPDGAPDAARPEGPAMILYTSGTTGRPKGVVSTHANIQAQVESLVDAWAWSPDDHILLHLPLHHVHGIVNVLTCALWSGARCQILERFDPEVVWERLARGDLTLYMAVPTVYRRLIGAWEAADPERRSRWSEGARRLRLMVSGSAALPVSTLVRWEEITGQRLLERYGMTEIGMALSNPLEGERRPGHVGLPLPRVEVRLVDDGGAPVSEGEPGEIQVRGPTVFREYWRRPAETHDAFTRDGWFRTGDQAMLDDGAYRILGRASVDILKTGGEKVSALEIEDVLRQRVGVVDCAVVGVPDPDWGERVCAAVVADPAGVTPTPEELRAFARDRLAPYKVPKSVLIVEELPRNAMGKVTKPEVRRLFETGEE
jgi:malonyl-CoA/methylmalonyl-CoA synthetase